MRYPLYLFAACAALALGLTACGDSSAEDEKNKGDKPSTPAAQPMTPPMTPPQKAEPAPARPSADAVVMKVNGIEIKQAAVDEVLQQQFGRRQTLNDEQLNQLNQQYGKKLEDRLIIDTLLDDAVAKADITVTDEDLTKEWGVITKQMPPGMNIEDALKRQGMTRAEADVQVRKQLTRRMFFEKVAPSDPITDEDVRKHYDKNLNSFKVQEKIKARHVLVMTKGDNEEQKKVKRTKIDEVRTRLLASEGKDFPQVAAEVSECPSGKKDGGSLGYFGRGQMVPEFDKMAFSLKVGEISPVIETSFGYHVIQVEEKQDAGTQPYEKVQDRIRDQLERGARRTPIDKYVQDLKAAAKVEHMTPPAPVETPKKADEIKTGDIPVPAGTPEKADAPKPDTSDMPVKVRPAPKSDDAPEKADAPK